MVICAISAWTIGSPGQIMVRALESASRRGHEVHVFAQKKRMDTTHPDPQLSPGWEASWVCEFTSGLTNDTGLHGCFSFFSTLRLIRELERINPDVIHLHNLHGWFLNLPLFFWWIKRRKTRVSHMDVA